MIKRGDAAIKMMIPATIQKRDLRQADPMIISVTNTYRQGY